MSRLEIDLSAVEGLVRGLQRTGERVQGTSRGLAGAAEPVGPAALVRSLCAFDDAWREALGRLGADCGRVGEQLAAAVAAYRAVDGAVAEASR